MHKHIPAVYRALFIMRGGYSARRSVTRRDSTREESSQGHRHPSVHLSVRPSIRLASRERDDARRVEVSKRTPFRGRLSRAYNRRIITRTAERDEDKISRTGDARFRSIR